uniref:glucuronosyltransferase n=1 Tax=Caenorhabditis tropicalis TaxID=1561998 RepID=A0A1I7UM42_9PELO
MRILSLFVLLSIVLSVNSYKILFYTNLFGHSHVKFLGAAADTLTDAGHNVTVLMPVFDPTLKTSLKSTKNVIRIESTEDVDSFIKARTSMLANMWLQDQTNPLTMLKKVEKMSQIFKAQCRKVLEDTELIEKIKAENYDLAITEPFDTCAYPFFEAVNIRAHVAVISSSRLDHVSDVIGQPAAPSYNPGLMSSNGDKMTITQRFMNVIQYVCGSYFFSYRNCARSFICIDKSNSIIGFPAPTFDKIVPVGGLSVKTDKKALKLEEKWSKILDIRKKNVFISFGSNARSIDMPLEYKNSMLRVIKSMPDTTFIWKYEDPTDKFTEGIPNVYLGDWLPQNELLADPRLNVFLTHGGLGSVTELSMMGVPAVMVPLMADQSRNAQMLKRHGGAAVLKKTDLADTELVRKTIQKVLNEPEYCQNAVRLAEMLNNQPTNPKETLVKYVEFAARFGKLPSLDNYGRHQSFIQYFFLDIIAIISLISIFSLYISYRIVKCAFRKCFGTGCSRSESKSKKE